MSLKKTPKPASFPGGAFKQGVKALSFPGGKRHWPLDPPEEKAGIEAGKGSSKAGGGAAGGGIDSPLTEKTRSEQKVVNGVPQTSGGSPVMVDVPDREYYAERVLRSSDGLFSFKIRDLKTSKFTDAKSRSIQLKWADPKDEPT